MDAGGIMPRCRSAVISHSGGPMRGPRSSFVSLLIVSLALAAGGALLAQRGQGGGRGQQANRVEIQEGQECPLGMTEVRHLQCQAPAEPAPSIVDYRQRPTVGEPQTRR